jgi:ferric-dicitrate binding protein FerR (iron transport regulator)
VLCCAAVLSLQALIKRYPEILRNLRPLPASLDIREIPRSFKPWSRQRRRQQQHWLAAAAAVLPVNAQPGQQQQLVKQQQGLPSPDELLVSPKFVAFLLFLAL